jgi:transcriptional regulator
MGRRVLSTQQVAEACELRERGLSCQQIADRFVARGVAVSPAGIESATLREGAEIPAARWRRSRLVPGSSYRRGNVTVRIFTPEEDARILALATAGHRHFEIARELGRKQISIRNRLILLARNEARAEA